MRLTPKTDEELFNLLDDGEYDFVVMKAEDQVSKSSGSEMIKLTLNVEGRQIIDYLLDSMAFKLKHFCQVTGLISLYEAGSFDSSDCYGRSGVVKIGREKAQGNYQAKNKVMDYVVNAAPAAPKEEGFQPDGDIPF